MWRSGGDVASKEKEEEILNGYGSAININMSYIQDFNVFVGGTTGVFKGLKVNKQTCIQKNIQSLVAITDNHEITTMAWGDAEEREILIACGAKETRSVKIYDTEHSTFTSSFNCDVGIGKIRGISRFDDAIITAVESGDVKLWRYDESEQLLISAGENLHRMRHSKINKNIIATGGRENELKLFDLERREKVFTEKNVPPDMLQLRMPVWVSDIAFLPNSSLVVTTSKYGHIRLYDPGSQRRPIIDLRIEDQALTTLAIAPKEKHVVVGSGKGRMNLIDLRNPGKILNTYKGFAGGITDLACSQSEPLIVSVGLDRHLRIHHLETKKLLEKVYLVSSLNAMLLRSSFSLKADDQNLEENVVDANIHRSQTADISSIDSAGKSCVNLDPESDAEYDKIFSGMPVIHNTTNDAHSMENKRHYPYKRATIVDSAMESGSADENKKSLTLSRSKKKTKFR